MTPNNEFLNPQPLPKTRLISFGAGDKRVVRALKRLQKQAASFPLIDEVETFSEGDLGEDYYSNFGRITASGSRGFGLWSWKPYLIHRELSKLTSGDILIYVDAGVELNNHGQSRFTHYLDFLARNDALLFSLDHQQRHWTKNDSRIFPSGQDYFRNQVVAGVILLRVCEETLALVSDWKDLSEIDGGVLLEDPARNTPEWHTDLRHHRHDQSLLSKVAFKHQLVTIPDETMFRPWSAGRVFPFLALRNKRSAHSWIPWATRTPFIVWQLTYTLSDRFLRGEAFSNLRRIMLGKRP